MERNFEVLHIYIKFQSSMFSCTGAEVMAAIILSAAVVASLVPKPAISLSRKLRVSPTNERM